MLTTAPPCCLLCTSPLLRLPCSPQDPLQQTSLFVRDDPVPQLGEVSVEGQLLEDGMSMRPVER